MLSKYTKLWNASWTRRRACVTAIKPSLHFWPSQCPSIVSYCTIFPLDTLLLTFHVHFHSLTVFVYLATTIKNENEMSLYGYSAEHKIRFWRMLETNILVNTDFQSIDKKKKKKSKYLLLCSKVRMPCRFVSTQWWVNNDRIFCFGLNLFKTS